MTSSPAPIIKKILLLVVLLCGAGGLVAQQKLPRSEKRKILKEADYAFTTEDFGKAWLQYKKILDADSANETAGLNAAISALYLKYDFDSLNFIKEALHKSSLIDAKYFSARMLHQEKKFDEALAVWSKYKSYAAAKRQFGLEEIIFRENQSVYAKQMIAEARPSIIKNIGPEVNSPYPDYVPVLMPDESALYFTSKRPGMSAEKNADNRFFEDVFVSKKIAGNWQKAELLPSPINTANNDACVSVSADGQRMILFRTADDLLTGNLYETRLTGDNKWLEPKVYGPEINSESIETSACFSSDTNEIYFSSDRPGGFGGKDIYRIRKLPNGNWSKPYNLGENVNTKYDDDAPFMHPDGVTLYFSSQGHNSIGGHDIFKTSFSVAGNTYSKAENLGYPINDVRDDIFFVLSVDGQRGYYSSVKPETYGGLDIYEIDTRFAANDLQVLPGFVSLSGNPGRAHITLTDPADGSLVGTYLSNEGHGRFIMIVNPYKSYRLSAEAENHHPVSIDLQPLAKQNSIGPVRLEFKKKENQ